MVGFKGVRCAQAKELQDVARFCDLANLMAATLAFFFFFMSGAGQFFTYFQSQQQFPSLWLLCSGLSRHTLGIILPCPSDPLHGTMRGGLGSGAGRGVPGSRTLRRTLHPVLCVVLQNTCAHLRMRFPPGRRVWIR